MRLQERTFFRRPMASSLLTLFTLYAGTTLPSRSRHLLLRNGSA
jgi:hypothetical protein